MSPSMEETLLAGMNEQQREAVLTTDGPLLIMAGAGSGKTRVITHRIAYLLAVKKVSPYNILAITFTNKAAREMKERVEQLVGPQAEEIWISTFHSLCARILRRDIDRLGYDRHFTILDTQDQLAVIKECLKQLNLDEKRFNPRSLLSSISAYKNELKTAEQVSQLTGNFYDEIVADVYAAYEKMLRDNSALDFDDLIMKTVELFKTVPDVLDFYQRKFQYIHVDEYQDTNRAQYQLVKLLAAFHRNLCVVGDHDQCLVPDTKVVTPEGTKQIGEIKEGDSIISACGWGETSPAQVEKVLTKEYSGPIVKLRTRCGHELLATPNHLMFGKLTHSPNLFYIYLMYKKGKGYRIGMTRGVRSGHERGTIVSGLQIRTNQETADKLWIIATTDNEEQAHYLEQYFAFKYGIPTTVFHVRGRRMALNQESIDRLFNEIDTEQRAQQLMEDRLIFEEYPHYRAGAVTREGVARKKVAFVMFGDLRKYQGRTWRDHRIQLITSDLELKAKAVGAQFPDRDGARGTWRVETARKSYTEGMAYVKRLAALDDLELDYRARLSDEKGEGKSYLFLPAAHIHEGMLIPVNQDGKIVADEVVEREIIEYEGPVYDLSVPNFHNYIANQIVVHNSIYRWRGADISIILSFEEDYPDAQVIKLEQNYRSTKRILEAANEVIKHNVSRREKKLWTANPLGNKIKYYQAQNEHDEAYFITRQIVQEVEGGRNYRDFAVLYRTNAQSRVLEEVFVKANIPYRIVGGVKFYERKEIKDILAYLRLIANPNDEISFRRIVNVPKRGIGQTTLDKLAAYAAEREISLFKALEELDQIGLQKRAQNQLARFQEQVKQWAKQAEYLAVSELTELVLEETGYKEALLQEGTLEAKSRLENVEEFLSVTLEFEKKNEEQSLPAFLDEIALVTDLDQLDEGEQTNAVTLMTLHAAKGLEFPVVFIAGMENNLFPHSRSALDEEELEEERRLAYVGITRAEEELYLTNARLRTIFGQTVSNPPSCFIDELPEEHVEVIPGPGSMLGTNGGIMASSAIDGEAGSSLSSRRPSARHWTAQRTGLSASEDKRGVGSEPDGELSQLKAGDKVRHAKWGIGTIVSIKGEKDDLELTIAFDPPIGLKRVLASFAPISKVN